MRGIRGIREGRCIGDWGRLGTGGLGPTRSAGKGRDEGVWWRTHSGGKERGAGRSFPLLALRLAVWLSSRVPMEFHSQFTASPRIRGWEKERKDRINTARRVSERVLAWVHHTMHGTAVVRSGRRLLDRCGSSVRVSCWQLGVVTRPVLLTLLSSRRSLRAIANHC